MLSIPRGNHKNDFFPPHYTLSQAESWSWKVTVHLVWSFGFFNDGGLIIEVINNWIKYKMIMTCELEEIYEQVIMAYSEI